ncbi:7146_t:CDS:1, partial [Funneliformis geosporum]
MLLCNKEFDDEFEEFCKADNPILYEFSQLYNFVKTHIYFIIIHRQQVEGLFNKLDLKTHANMSLSLKQSKLRLASSKIEKEKLMEGLEKIRA